MMEAPEAQFLKPILVVRIHGKAGSAYAEILHLDHKGQEHYVGRLDYYKEGQFTRLDMKPTLREALSDGITRVVVDLEHVTWFDSTALAELVEWYHMLGKVDGKLVIAHPSSKILNVFEVTKLDSVFPVFSTMHDAQEHLKKKSAGI